MGASEWGRLGLIILIALIYISIFIALGLLVSARTSRSSVSLMVLLLIWTVVVVLMPSTLGSITSNMRPTMTGAEYYGRQNQIWDDLFNRYGGQGGRLWTEPLSREIPPNKITADWAKILTTEAERHERLTEEHLKDRTSQALFAMNINRVSPASAVQYAIESLAGGGLLRYLDFLDGVRRHGVEFRQFLIETDLADTESPHAFGVSIGTSQKPMNFEAIPKFEDEITFGGAFNIAMVDMLLLVLFLVALSAGAYLSFLRTEIG